MKRKLFLDNIRWLTVLLVVVYHVFYLFNSCGVEGGFGPFAPVQYQDALLVFVYPWFMVLLFVVAGVSSRYALQKQTVRAFIAARTTKLLVPSTLGLFVLQWVGGYVNTAIADAWSQMPADMPLVAKYLIAALSGIGPLWFAQTLWLFSLLLPLIRRLDRHDRFYALCGQAKLPVLLALAVLMWAAAQVLNTPVITVYRFGIYGVAFLLGYFVFAHDAVQERLEKAALPLVIAAAVVGVAYTICWFGQYYAGDACLKHPFTALYLWLAVLAIFGAAKKWYNHQGKLAAYLSRSSYGLYVLHFMVLVLLCWGTHRVLHLPAAAVYGVGLILTPVLSLGLYELIRRIPVVRWCVLGIRKQRR